MKRLPASRNVRMEQTLLAELAQAFGKENIKVVEKSIENGR